jgi:hypothetical protein
MVDRFDQFTKLLPFELWLDIYDIIREDFKTKQNILEKMDIITLSQSDYCPWHYTGVSKGSVRSPYIMISLPIIQIEVTYLATIHLSQTFAFSGSFIGYYVTTGWPNMEQSERPPDFITSLSVPLIY